MLDLVIDARRRDLGGFEVGRLLPDAKRRSVGPFVFLDHMGPVRFPPGIPRTVDVRPHPHIGLSTVTYLLSGEIMHRDSVGSEQAIRPAEINWMTAGRGITHSERFEQARREGGPLHGLQAWVALPEADEECEPAFFHHGPEDLPAFHEAGPAGAGGGAVAHGRLLAGSAYGLRARVRTNSPLSYVHWTLEAGARCALPSDATDRAAYVVSGAVEVDGRRIEAGHLAVFASGGDAVLRAVEGSVVMALGGEPLGPRHLEWNFVSSSRERLEQAKADWRAGRMKLPDADHDEFIPWPGDAPGTGAPPAPPMS